jgi:hypothetical protein
MQIIATDILADLCGLSLGLIVLVIPVGLLLWLLGWWSHRFWIVLATTVLAGVIGLNEATTWRAQPIVVAVLLAIAAGVLALALIRVIAFISGGIAGLSLLQMIYPTLNQPVIIFLVCGLLSLLLFRWCFMILTSLLGASLLVYATLALVHYYEFIDVVTWSEENSLMLNSACGIITFIGFVCQFLLNRGQKKRAHSDEEGPFASILGSVGGKKKSKREAA